MSALPPVQKPSVSHKKGIVVHDNPFQCITKVTSIFENFQKDYYVVDFGPRAGVVAIKNDNILLSGQYRFLIDAISWELPGGRVDAGEDSVTAAYRECLEETGIQCFNLHPLLTYRPGLDNVENLTEIFYTEETTEAFPFIPDPKESLKIAWLPLEQAVSLVLSHQITDAMTVAGILGFFALKNQAKKNKF